MGSLLWFPDLENLSLEERMERIELQKTVNEFIQAVASLYQAVEPLPPRVREKIMRVEKVNYSPEYQPWGGLFPHPKWREE